MRFFKIISTAALMAIVAVPGGAQARTQAPGGIPVLARTTTVVGSESAYTRVRLPRAVHSNKTFVEYAGDGRAVGFALVDEVDGRIPKHPHDLEGVRFGDCFEEGCPASHLHDGWGWGGSGGVYPPGIYRLYVIADGATATVTLTFPELTGETTIAPTTPARVQVQTLTSLVSVEATHSLYAAGATSPFKGKGLSWMQQTIDAPGSGTAAYDYCIYWEEAPLLEAIAYLPPNCPKGLPQHRPQIKEYAHPGEEFLGAGVGTYPLPAAIGNWYATSTPIDAGGSVAVWLKF